MASRTSQLRLSIISKLDATRHVRLFLVPERDFRKLVVVFVLEIGCRLVTEFDGFERDTLRRNLG